MRSILFYLFLLLPWNAVHSQENFRFPEGVDKDKIPFELINNLIVIPVELNGLQLSFLLDTGVDTTVLFGINENDTLDITNAEKIMLRGIGGDDYVEALKSDNNSIKVGKAERKDLTLYLILDHAINFSPRLGFPVHGIIGHDLFGHFIVEINYQRKFLRLHEPDQEIKKLRNYQAVPLVFFKNKPYLNAELQYEDKIVQGTFLLDSGLADALWLFENDEDISIPGNAYEDFIGLGLVGDIYGKRSKVRSLKVSDFLLRDVNASYPDIAAFGGLKFLIGRNGSIGAEILRRFHLVVHYRERKLYLRRNNDFADPFLANLAGITVEHAGFIVIENYAKLPSFSEDRVSEGTEVFSSKPKLTKTFSLRPEFKIVRLRKGSPAQRAGLKVGDTIVSINGKKGYRLEMEDISSLFSSEVGAELGIVVKRLGREVEFRFLLEDPFQEKGL